MRATSVEARTHRPHVCGRGGLVGTQELEDCIGVVFQVTIDCAFVEVEIGVLALSIEV